MVWGGIGILCLGFSELAISDCPAWERAVFAMLLTTPALFLARLGHFGKGGWRFPTVVAQVYLVWTFGLLPSLAAAHPPETGIYLYKPLAKLVGGLAFLIWFSAFALGAGAVSDQDSVGHESGLKGASPHETFSRWAFLLSFLFWLIPYGGAANQGMLSSWGQMVKMEEVAGTTQGTGLLLYNAFVGLLPLLAFWSWLKSSGRWRLVFLILLSFAILALILYSNRRITLISFFVSLYFLHRMGRPLHWRRLALMGCGAALMMGPLLWPLRMALQNRDLLKAQDDIFAIAKESIGRYITDPEFRELAELAGKENRQGGRFNYADTYLATVQWNLENGAHKSPSILFAPISFVPSVMWAGKNDTAAGLNVKRQFIELGISNEPDFPMTPLQEAFFQYGYLGVLLGGMFWGWFSRLLMRQLSAAWETFEGMLIWVAFLFGAMSFEGFFSMFLPLVREPVALGLLLVLFRKGINLWRSGAISSESPISDQT